MITAQIRANGGLSYHTGPTLAAVIRDQFGPDAAVVHKGPVPGERPVIVDRDGNRIVVGSVVSTDSGSAA